MLSLNVYVYLYLCSMVLKPANPTVSLRASGLGHPHLRLQTVVSLLPRKAARQLIKPPPSTISEDQRNVGSAPRTPLGNP